MKTHIISICFLLVSILSVHNAHAQRRENVIKVGLLEPIYSTFGLSYERFVPESELSFQLGGSVTQHKIKIWENLEPKAQGFSAELQARYYYPLNNQSLPSGIYTGLFGEYSRYKIAMTIPEGDINFLDGHGKFFGFLLGYQFGFKSRLFIDATVGGGYHFADYSGKFSQKGHIIPSLVSNGILPKVDLKMGIAF